MWARIFILVWLFFQKYTHLIPFVTLVANKEYLVFVFSINWLAFALSHRQKKYLTSVKNEAQNWLVG